jgi:hypothetical protein
VLDIPDVRDWGDEYSAVLQRSLVESIRQARAINPQGVVDATGAVNVLALSGAVPMARSALACCAAGRSQARGRPSRL